MSCIKNLVIDIIIVRSTSQWFDVGFAGAFRLDAQRNHKWRHIESQVSNCFSGGSFWFLPFKNFLHQKSWVLNTSCQGIQIHEIHETQWHHHVFVYFGCDFHCRGHWWKVFLLRGSESQHHWHGAHFYLPWLGRDMIHWYFMGRRWLG